MQWIIKWPSHHLMFAGLACSSVILNHKDFLTFPYRMWQKTPKTKYSISILVLFHHPFMITDWKVGSLIKAILFKGLGGERKVKTKQCALFLV